MILFSLLAFAIGAPVQSTKISGQFQITGFSFGGKLPGTIYLGSEEQFQIQLNRPSGIPLISVVYTGEEVCLHFDFDNLYYSGTSDDFKSLTGDKLHPENFYDIFTGSQKAIPYWSWNNRNDKLRKLTIEAVAEVRYLQWKQGRFNRITIDIIDSGWKVKGNLHQREDIIWDFQCQKPIGSPTHPLNKMKEAMAPKE